MEWENPNSNHEKESVEEFQEIFLYHKKANCNSLLFYLLQFASFFIV